MTQRNDPHRDAEEPPRTDDRYVGFETENGYLLYDSLRDGAWIESDTTLERVDAV